MTKKAEDKGRSALLLGLVGVAVVSIFLSMFFSVQAGLLLLAGAWVVAFSWMYPKYAFFALLFFAPVLPILKITETLSLITPLKDFVILALFLRVVVLPIVQKKDPYRKNTVLFPILLLLVCVIVGVLRADSYLVGVLRLRDILLYIPMLWVARGLIVTQRDFLNLLKVIFSSVGLTLFLALIQTVFFADGAVLRFDPFSNSWIPRASSVLAHPNNLGSYLVITLPIIFVYALRKNILAVLTAIVGLIVVYLTYSRSVWVAFVAIIISLVFIIAKNNKKIKVKYFVIGLFVVAIGLVAFPRLGNLLRTTIDPTYGSNAERLQILTGLVASSNNASVLIGKGLGDITDREINISLTDIVSADTQNVQTAKDRTFVDNAVVKTWTEVGLAGLMIVSFLLWRVFVLGWNVLSTEISETGRIFATGFLSATIGLIVMSFFLDIPEVFPIALYWWTFVGSLEAITYFKNK